MASPAPTLLAPVPPAPRVTCAPAVPVAALDADLSVLDRLREAARRARAERQLSLGEAMQVLRCPGAAAGASEALVRVLGEFIGRRPVFHAPGCAMASFDEAWLMRCHGAQRARDVDSLTLLTGRRLPKALRRPFLDLLRAL